MDEKRLFWSPAVRWIKNEEELQIEIYKYQGRALSLFPQFYYLTQNGITKEELIRSFHATDSGYVANLIRDFINKRILISGIMSPKELFFTQKRLYTNECDESIKFVKEEYEFFKKEMVNRIMHSGPEDIKLQNADTGELFQARHTARLFDQNKQVSFQTLCSFLSILKQKDNGTFYHPSAGGLSPIDTYLYIKDNRVEHVTGGYYYYNSVDHKLSPIYTEQKVGDKHHFVTNKEIFQTSAFSVFFVYNSGCNMPRYDGNGYFYGLLDMGAMMENVNLNCADLDLGCCSIGDMDFAAVEHHLQLSEGNVVLHDMEIGWEE